MRYIKQSVTFDAGGDDDGGDDNGGDAHNSYFHYEVGGVPMHQC